MNLSLEEERGPKFQQLGHQHALSVSIHGVEMMATRPAGFVPALKDRASARDTR